MELKETEKTTEVVLERMENTMMNLEQMSFDSINITDRIVTLLSDARELFAAFKTGDEKDKELEKETVYQRETVDSIRQIVDYLYAISGDGMF